MRRTAIMLALTGAAFCCAFLVPVRKSRKVVIREEKALRENLTEAQIDKTLKDSFPASDPPGWY